MGYIKRSDYSIFSLIQAKTLALAIFVSFIFNFFFFPFPILAQKSAKAANVDKNNEEFGNFEVSGSGVETLDNFRDDNVLPKLPFNDDLLVKSSSFRVITSYNSEAGQTDDSPCITANNFDLCEHGFEDSVAANFLPFGAKVRIPELFGDRVFIVRDRMHKRFSDRVDVWMIKKQDAVNFGAKYAKIEVLDN